MGFLSKKKEEQPEIIGDLQALVETVIIQGKQIDILEKKQKIMEERLMPLISRLGERVTELEDDSKKQESELRTLRARVSGVENKFGIKEDEE